MDRAASAACAHEERKGLGDIKLILLAHIREVLKEWPPERLITVKRLCERLNEREDWPWGGMGNGAGLTPNGLGSMMKAMDITLEKKKWCPEEQGQVRPYSRARIEEQTKLYLRDAD